MDTAFWKDKRVFITGHTGFKGSWLTLWLNALGADVYGYSLEPPTTPSLFLESAISDQISSTHGDVLSLESLMDNLRDSSADIVFHMAAQSLVRESYEDPVNTYATNVMGTVHLLEAVRQVESVKAVVIVTSDKCYENKEWHWGYRENEPMGGFDPYSNSKGCSELVTSAYRNSFFSNNSSTLVASGRAGNVIGGGDWAKDRLVPDTIRAFIAGDTLQIRNPDAVRPWQHVLEPLRGYMMLAQKLYSGDDQFAQGWNFGPDMDDIRPVSWISDRMVELWGEGSSWAGDHSDHPHEANFLALDHSLARKLLSWKPVLKLPTALEWIVDWNKARESGRNVTDITIEQILKYQALTGES
jgi:CDP-glucose 4,6-dehydratase